ncbi:MAG: type II secretion system protein [Gemmatimonadaceae bacterium]
MLKSESTVSAGRRGGFTLVELMIVVVLLGLVSAVLLQLVINQQRFYNGAAEIIETRGSVRQMAEAIPGDLRSLAPTQDDIYSMGSTFIEYRAPIGSSVFCAGGLATITIPPIALASQSGLTAWINTPQAGDSLFIYDAVGPGIADDRWRIHELAAAPVLGTCPTASTFTANAAEANSGWTLVLNPALTVTTQPGASIRFFRRARYQLYLAADGRNYLGYYDCLATRMPACSTIQPVSGPYLEPGSGGLVMSYFDSTGTVTASPNLVSRIDIIARAASRNVVRSDGRQHGLYRDSLSIRVAVRN